MASVLFWQWKSLEWGLWYLPELRSPHICEVRIFSPAEDPLKTQPPTERKIQNGKTRQPSLVRSLCVQSQPSKLAPKSSARDAGVVLHTEKLPTDRPDSQATPTGLVHTPGASSSTCTSSGGRSIYAVRQLLSERPSLLLA